MEVKVDGRQDLYMEIQSTTSFIPLKNETEDFPESNICLERTAWIHRQDVQDDRLEFEIIFNAQKTSSRIVGLSFNISECPRSQIYIGSSLEFFRTESGIKQSITEMDIYKYDIDFRHKPQKMASMKFLAKAEEVNIFGIDVFTMESKNENPGFIDVANVESMLANVELTDAAKKCKGFLTESMKRANNPTTAATLTTDLIMKGLEQKFADFEQRLMDKIDAKFNEIQVKQDQQFQRILDKAGEGPSQIS